MNPAINELEIRLSVMENNEPINRAEGNIAQADLEAANAASYRKAIEALRAIEASA
jgi:hypothetical protein